MLSSLETEFLVAVIITGLFLSTKLSWQVFEEIIMSIVFKGEHGAYLLPYASALLLTDAVMHVATDFYEDYGENMMEEYMCEFTEAYQRNVGAFMVNFTSASIISTITIYYYQTAQNKRA